MRNITAAVREWEHYFLLMNYTSPLPNVARATQLCTHTVKFYAVPDVVLTLLDPLQLKELEDIVTNSTAWYALLAHHALVLHAQGMHEKEEDIYGCLSAMDTQDWPMKRDAMLDRIRCLRERHLSETESERNVHLCQQIRFHNRINGDSLNKLALVGQYAFGNVEPLFNLGDEFFRLGQLAVIDLDIRADRCRLDKPVLAGKRFDFIFEDPFAAACLLQ